MKMAQRLAPETAMALIDNAYNIVYAHLTSVGDGLIPHGLWASTSAMLSFSVVNADNHQMTWGVLGSTLWGLKDFMTQSDIYACAYISIFDGINLVGTGKIDLL